MTFLFLPNPPGLLNLITQPNFVHPQKKVSNTERSVLETFLVIL